MDRETILVTGSNGVVGSYIPSVFRGSTLYLTSRTDMDITKRNVVLKKIKSIRPTTIIHLAANTNVDDCEKDSKKAHDVNYQGTQNIADAASQVGATIIYMSTSAIFNGEKEFYLETDKPSPINIYGKTKLLGEQAIINTLSKYYILRCGWVIGGGIRQKKFISYIMNQLYEGKKEIFAVNDMFGSIAYAKELVMFMKKILHSQPYGIYHFGSQGICSRYDIARYIVDILGTQTKVTPVSSDRFRDRFFAPRPKHEVVRSIKKQYNRIWQESLREYINSEIQTAKP